MIVTLAISQNWQQNKTKYGHPLPTQVHHKGWMVSGQETVFCWVPVHKLTMVGSSGSFFKPTYLLITTAIGLEWTSTHQHTIHCMALYDSVVDEPQPESTSCFTLVTHCVRSRPESVNAYCQGVLRSVKDMLNPKT
jgi:hypothetical protein